MLGQKVEFVPRVLLLDALSEVEVELLYALDGVRRVSFVLHGRPDDVERDALSLQVHCRDLDGRLLLDDPHHVAENRVGHLVNELAVDQFILGRAEFSATEVQLVPALLQDGQFILLLEDLPQCHVDQEVHNLPDDEERLRLAGIEERLQFVIVGALDDLSLLQGHPKLGNAVLSVVHELPALLGYILDADVVAVLVELIVVDLDVLFDVLHRRGVPQLNLGEEINPLLHDLAVDGLIHEDSLLLIRDNLPGLI